MILAINLQNSCNSKEKMKRTVIQIAINNNHHNDYINNNKNNNNNSVENKK